MNESWVTHGGEDQMDWEKTCTFCIKLMINAKFSMSSAYNINPGPAHQSRSQKPVSGSAFCGFPVIEYVRYTLWLCASIVSKIILIYFQISNRKSESPTNWIWLILVYTRSLAGLFKLFGQFCQDKTTWILGRAIYHYNTTQCVEQT